MSLFVFLCFIFSVSIFVGRTAHAGKKKEKSKDGVLVALRQLEAWECRSVNENVGKKGVLQCSIPHGFSG